MTVRFTDEAIEDLASIRAYLVEQAQPPRIESADA